ncbi:MAG TPA: EVE domain-containing protein [Humibacillus sp.]|nr:EVE domain-containing protein [Humibacillus sp.]
MVVEPPWPLLGPSWSARSFHTVADTGSVWRRAPAPRRGRHHGRRRAADPTTAGEDAGSRCLSGDARYVSRVTNRRSWVIVAARDHARRGVRAGFVMANHGKRAPLARMSPGDGILIYSPSTDYPDGEPLRAVTIVGEVTGEQPEPSDVIAGGFHRAARLREIEPIPLAEIRDHLPVSRLRFGFFELESADAEAIWTRVAQHDRRGRHRAGLG